MEIRVSFPGHQKVAASFEGFTVLTDQPKEAEGDGTAPTPFDLFLASLAACAGIFVLSFCRSRGLSTDGLEVIERADRDERSHRVTEIALDIVLPADFPQRYEDGVRNAANLCTVKKTLHDPPSFEIRTTRRAARA